MPFPACPCHACLARFLAISLCMQTGLVVGRSRATVVGSGRGGSSLFPAKTQGCFVGSLSAVAWLALKALKLSFWAKRSCNAADELRQARFSISDQFFWSDNTQHESAIR